MATNEYRVYIYPAAEGHPGMVELRAFRGGDTAIIIPVSVISLAKMVEDAIGVMADHIRKTG